MPDSGSGKNDRNFQPYSLPDARRRANCRAVAWPCQPISPVERNGSTGDPGPAHGKGTGEGNPGLNNPKGNNRWMAAVGLWIGVNGAAGRMRPVDRYKRSATTYSVYPFAELRRRQRDRSGLFLTRIGAAAIHLHGKDAQREPVTRQAPCKEQRKQPKGSWKLCVE